MKMRGNQKSGIAKNEIPMAPMIDIVFQLLVFFILTLKVSTQEGDFGIKMPLAAAKPGIPTDDQLPPMTLRMQADKEGRLVQMLVGERSFGTDFDGLQRHVRSYIGEDTGPGGKSTEAEIEFDCDYNLRYEYVIMAITHVTGERRGSDIIKLIEKIKFSPPKPPPAA